MSSDGIGTNFMGKNNKKFNKNDYKQISKLTSEEFFTLQIIMNRIKIALETNKP